MERHRTALGILAAALLLGVIGDTMLRYIPPGVNVLVFAAVFIGAALWLAPRRLPVLFPAACALAGAIGFVWRDAEPLLFLDLVLLAVFLPMLALEARGVRITNAGIAEVVGAHITTGFQSVIGFPQLAIGDLSWSRVPRGGVRGAGVALRGTLIAAPALLVFGALLASADQNFEDLLRNAFAFELDDLAGHIVITAAIAAVCAGFYRSLALSGPMPRIASLPRISLPAPETNFALGLVNLLFAAFVATQFRYFFGAAPDTLAQYARRGFFELVAVVALVMPMLLLIEWLIDKEKGTGPFRALAVTQIVLVFAIAFSAYRKMQLYRDEYGLTQERIFATAFMIWVAVLLIWFVLTVLAGRRGRFIAGALATGTAAVVILHAINPDRMIVETNLARAQQGLRAFDAFYAGRLSDDAAEPIIRNADAMGPGLWLFLNRERTIGWRTWNLSRARAIALIRSSGVERHPANRAPLRRSARIDARVEELAKVGHLQEQMPVTDTVHGDRQEQQGQHREEDSGRGTGDGQRRR